MNDTLDRVHHFSSEGICLGCGVGARVCADVVHCPKPCRCDVCKWSNVRGAKQVSDAFRAESPENERLYQEANAQAERDERQSTEATLVERLRSEADGNFRYGTTSLVLREAADKIEEQQREIERLRGKIKRVKSLLRKPHTHLRVPERGGMVTSFKYLNPREVSGALNAD